VVEEVDLCDLVREVVAPYNQNDEQVRLRLQPIQPFALRRVSMKRLLNNLIGNALHHAGMTWKWPPMCLAIPARLTWC
jgi:two-component system, OmpR family, osmolarity sensor histidine kinase EnvZ